MKYAAVLAALLLACGCASDRRGSWEEGWDEPTRECERAFNGARVERRGGGFSETVWAMGDGRREMSCCLKPHGMDGVWWEQPADLTWRIIAYVPIGVRFERMCWEQGDCLRYCPGEE